LEAKTGSWRTTTVETERILQEIQVILTSEAPLTTKRTDFARNPSNFNFAGRESISTIKSILAIPERPENLIIKLREYSAKIKITWAIFHRKRKLEAETGS
jgi:hypothetical protein